MAKANKQYEAMFLFGQAAAQDLDGTIRSVRSIVERHGGEILHIKRWDERKLAYEIKKQKRGLTSSATYRAPGKLDFRDRAGCESQRKHSSRAGRPAPIT